MTKYSPAQTGDIQDKYILKQWIVSNTRADWLVKLRISGAIYLQATRGKWRPALHR